jgi:hypothetical protein
VSGLSYVESEFDYAQQRGKPFFSVVMSEDGLDRKVRQHGRAVTESQNEPQYRAFKERVTSQLCAFFQDLPGVKLAVFETLPQLATRADLVGWVSGREAAADPALARELARLSEDNRKLRAEVEALRVKLSGEWGTMGSYEDLVRVLSAEMVTLPAEMAGGGLPERSLLVLLVNYGRLLATGVSNRMAASKIETFLFYHVASRLFIYGLVQYAKVQASVQWSRLVLSKSGARFLAEANSRLQNSRAKQRDTMDSPAVSEPPSSPAAITPGPSMNEISERTRLRPKRQAGTKTKRRRAK